MKVPLSWLNEYVDVSDLPPLELAERLTLAGLEVAAIEFIGIAPPPGAEALISAGDSFPWDRETIRVGEVLTVEPHPNADRLVLATVDYGAEAPLTVVTGAPNVRPGQKVAFATTGALIRNGYSAEHELVKLKPAKIRGVRSEGMVLSELELGLSDEHEGILELDPEAPVGVPLADWLGDVVLEIELTPNLARAYSIVGVAREVAAIYARALKPVPTALVQTGPSIEGQIAIKICHPEACPRFTATLIRDVEIKPAPFWMQRRLRLAGMRPINNIVDITNYVMLETGQPLHAFDYDVLVRRAAASDQPANPVTGEARPTLIMRYAEPGERLTTLDGVNRNLVPTDYLVTDTYGALSLAGVMGGEEGEVSEATRNVLLEAANWNFIMIRRTQQRHLIFSEAGLRFSRGVHPAQAEVGNRRAAELMRQLGGGTVAQGLADEYPAPPPVVQIELTTAEVERQLGMAIPADRIAGHLRRLQFRVEPTPLRPTSPTWGGTGGGAEERLLVTAPDHRLDISGTHDLIEEIARIEGYNTIPSTLMADPLPPMRQDPTLDVEERIRDLLTAAGLQESISYRLTSPEREGLLVPGASPSDITEEGYVRLANPSSRERRVLRRTLLVSALENLQNNLRFRERVAIFEIGQVYQPVPGQLLPQEQPRLVIVLSGTATEPSWLVPEPPPVDYFDLKGIVEALLEHLHLRERARFVPSDHPTFQPGRTADLYLDDSKIGTLGELHPLVRQAHGIPLHLRVPAAELALDPLMAAAPRAWKVEAVPRFPPVVQDLALVVDEGQAAGEVERAIRAGAPPLLVDVELFDVYRGAPIPAGKKSLAYRLTYQAPDRTLTDAEVARAHDTIVAAVKRDLGAEVRGAGNA